MKVSAFTFIKNGQILGYPFLQSIQSVLPIVDEFVVNVGESEDDTLSLIKSLNSSKIRIIQSKWNDTMQDRGYVYGQQKMISIKKHFGTNKRNYLYLSGWMVAALRSEFGPLPDQSMHEKTSVPSLINEIYSFLKQADARELQHLFIELDEAREKGKKEDKIIQKIDAFETRNPENFPPEMVFS